MLPFDVVTKPPLTALPSSLLPAIRVLAEEFRPRLSLFHLALESDYFRIIPYLKTIIRKST